jgi:hypothetical protein
VPANWTEHEVRWFAWREVHPAFAHGRSGGIALHHFRYDLRRFGLGSNAPACHVIATDPDLLTAFVATFGLPARLIQAPKPHRSDIWHFDFFGKALDRLVAAYPPPADIDEN